MAKTRINVRQVDLELAGGASDYETMAEAVAAEGAALVGKLVPAKFDPKYLGVSLSVADYDGAASDYTIVNKGVLTSLSASITATTDLHMSYLNADYNALLTASAERAALQADIDQNEADADAAIAALQADVDQNETDGDTDRAAIRSEFAAADAIQWKNVLGAVGAVQADVDQNETDGDTDRAAIRSEFAAADTAILLQIATNLTNGTAALAAVQADVDGNEADADAADAVLQGQITSNDADIATNAADIATETARALAAEAVNAGLISAEATRATAAEGVLTTDVLELNADVLALHGRHFRASSVVVAGGAHGVSVSPADAGSLQVFVNGLLKVAGDDYTVTADGNGSVTDVSVLGCEAGDDVTVMGQGYVSLTS